MELVLSTLSDNDLYLYQFLSKYLIGFQSYRPEQYRIDARVVTNVYGRTYEWTYGRKIGSLYRAMPEAGATKKGFSRVNSIFFIPG